MIHYVTVGVALSRPPKVDEWRRYAIYGGTHTEATLVAEQMAAATSVMPVEVVDHGKGCLNGDCKRSIVDHHGVQDCRCWRVNWDEDVNAEAWQIEDGCPLHAEDTAAWVALDGGYLSAAVHGEPSDECRAGTCDCEAPEPEVVDHCRCGCPWPCKYLAAQGDGYPMHRKAGETPEQAAGALPPVRATGTDFIPPTYDRLMACYRPCPNCGVDHDTVACHPEAYRATGAIVPDELKRKPCTCPQVDVSTIADGPRRRYVQGFDLNCQVHGIDQGLARTTTEDGAAQCNSASPRRRSLWAILREWVLAWGPA